MTLKQVVKRAEERWDATKRIRLSDVELISKDRLTSPLVGEKLVKTVRVSELMR